MRIVRLYERLYEDVRIRANLEGQLQAHHNKKHAISKNETDRAERAIIPQILSTISTCRYERKTQNVSTVVSTRNLYWTFLRLSLQNISTETKQIKEANAGVNFVRRFFGFRQIMTQTLSKNQNVTSRPLLSVTKSRTDHAQARQSSLTKE